MCTPDYPYSINNNLTVTDVQLTSTTSSPPFDIGWNTYEISGDYLFRKKHETNKQKLIRQRSSFVFFYKKPEYVVTKRPNDFVAEYKEASQREAKFKGINLNLII